MPNGDVMAEHEHDYVDNVNDLWVYRVSEGDKASYAGSEDGSRINPSTPSDASYAAPNITPDTVVGIADIAGYEGRVVEEGYTADPDGDGTSSTYNRANENFYALGKAKLSHFDDGAVTGFAERVTVIVDKNL